MSKETLKDIRKVAFVIGFGVTAGKFAFECLVALAEGAFEGICANRAEHGNKRVKQFCDKHNIEYDESDSDEEFKMGFHA